MKRIIQGVRGNRNFTAGNSITVTPEATSIKHTDIIRLQVVQITLLCLLMLLVVVLAFSNLYLHNELNELKYLKSIAYHSKSIE